MFSKHKRLLIYNSMPASSVLGWCKGSFTKTRVSCLWCAGGGSEAQQLMTQDDDSMHNHHFKSGVTTEWSTARLLYIYVFSVFVSVRLLSLSCCVALSTLTLQFMSEEKSKDNSLWKGITMGWKNEKSQREPAPHCSAQSLREVIVRFGVSRFARSHLPLFAVSRYDSDTCQLT